MSTADRDKGLLDDDGLALSSDLVTQASRLIRLVRQHLPGGANLRVLSMLDQFGPTTVTTLADADRCTQPTMSAAVGLLAKQGFVSKTPNPDDARSSLVTLTPAGHAEIAATRAVNGRLIAERLVATTDHDVADLAAAVRLLSDLLADPPLLDPEGAAE